MTNWLITSAVPVELSNYGYQYDVVLTNRGPATIYLDNNSNVSNTGLQLSPGASVVWNQSIPVYAIADSLASAGASPGVAANTQVPNTAILNVVMNSDDVTFNGNIDGAVYSNPTATITGTQAFATSELSDVTAYNSLIIETFFPGLAYQAFWAGINPSINGLILCRIDWYDINGNWLGNNTGRMANVQGNVAHSPVPASYPGNNPYLPVGGVPIGDVGGVNPLYDPWGRLTVPVRGAYCTFSFTVGVDGSNITVFTGSINIAGTTRVLPSRSAFSYADSEAYLCGLSGTGFPSTSKELIYTNDDSMICWQNPSGNLCGYLMMPGISSRVNISVYSQTGITSTSHLQAFSSVNAIYRTNFGQVAASGLAANAGVNALVEGLPITSPWFLGWDTKPTYASGNAAFQVSVVYL